MAGGPLSTTGAISNPTRYGALEMKRDWPEDFAKACQIDEELRQDDPHFWLHPSCTPLASVDFDVQQTMFADRGCMGGCFT